VILLLSQAISERFTDGVHDKALYKSTLLYFTLLTLAEVRTPWVFASFYDDDENIHLVASNYTVSQKSSHL